MNNVVASESINSPSPASGLNAATTVDNFLVTEVAKFKSCTQCQLMILQKRSQELKNELKVLHTRCENQAKECHNIQNPIYGIDSKVKPLTKSAAKQTDDINTVVKKFEWFLNKTQTEGNKLKENFDQIFREIEVLKQHLLCLQQPADLFSNNISSKKSSPLDEANISKKYEEFKRQSLLYNASVAQMDVRFQVLETTTYNGCLVWRIQDYYRRKEDAIRGQTLALYSQPFYSSRYGYKMCARIYLNGDERGKHTHISLYFVVMKGDYDPLLPWPFRQKVTMMCLDQGPRKRHIVDTFRPDPNSMLIKQPTNDINIVSGCPQFVPHSVIENTSYIQDNVLFMRIVVDTTGLD